VTLHLQVDILSDMAHTAPTDTSRAQRGAAVPYYQDDSVTIYHGDCREITAWLQGDVLVTDPPYGIAYETNRAATVERAVSIESDADPSLRDHALSVWCGRPAIVFGSWKQPRPPATRVVLTWVKGMHCGMGDLALPWKANTEEIYVLGSGFVGHRGSSGLDYPAPVTWASKGRSHPHEKPVPLLHDLIAKCPPGTIVDPFMGSGSTLRAAKDLGRTAIGVEIDERYCEIAARRMGQEVLALRAVILSDMSHAAPADSTGTQ
jgi:predicted RNA methylase